MRLLPPVLLVVALSTPAAARVVSYAPVTDRIATPVQQPRSCPQFVLIESDHGPFWGPGGGPAGDALPWYGWLAGRLVVHDVSGAREARVVLPMAGEEAWFLAVAARPGTDGALRILALTDADLAGTSTRGSFRLLFSSDGGASWKELAVPPGSVAAVPHNWSSGWSGIDFGGPVVRGRDPVLRLGSEASPFVLLLDAPARDGSGALVAIDESGAVRILAEVSAREANGTGSARLVGTSRDGGEILVAGRLGAPGAAGPGKPPHALWKARAAGGLEKLLDLAAETPAIED